jgi:type IV secretory pathway VirB10-like protein
MRSNHLPNLALSAAVAVSIVSFGSAAQLSATQPPQSQTTTQQPPPVPPAHPTPPPQQTPQPVPPAPNPVPPPTPAPSQPPATQPTQGATSATGQASTNGAQPTGNAAALLDRMSEIVDQALDGKLSEKSKKGTPGATGTSGVLKVGKSAAGTVVVDRSALDEIHAELEQLKIMLKDRQP